MALGKITIEKILKKTLQEIFDSEYVYEAPYFYKETEEGLCFVSLVPDNLGLTSIGRPMLSLKKINYITNPIFDKYNIIHNKWSTGLQAPLNDVKNLPYLNTDSESELKIAIDKFIEYIKNAAIPFWEKHKSIDNIVSLIENSTEEEMNQGIFQGVTGIMTRMTIAYLGDSNYYAEKKEFYKNLFKEYSEKKPEEYQKFSLAFNELIDILEKTKNKLV